MAARGLDNGAGCGSDRLLLQCSPKTGGIPVAGIRALRLLKSYGRYRTAVMADSKEQNLQGLHWEA